MCKDKFRFDSYKCIENETIYSADSNRNNELRAVGIGSIHIETKVNGDIFLIELRNVYHVPKIRRNLLSISQIEKQNKRLIFDNNTVKIIDKAINTIVRVAHERDGLYIVKLNDGCVETNIASRCTNEESYIWHQRFGHVKVSSIRELVRQNLIRGLDDVNISDIQCRGCNIGKSTKAPCKRIVGRQTKDVLELIHADLCGPVPVESNGGSKYFLTCTDDFSRKCTIYYLKSKSEIKSYIEKFIIRVERETDRKVKRFRTDNGLEFCNNDLKRLYNSLGIRHEKTNVYTPQMNGVAERVNRTMLDMVRAMLETAKLPDRFWAEALATACYIKNRIMHSAINDNTPGGIWTGNKPKTFKGVWMSRVRTCTEAA